MMSEHEKELADQEYDYRDPELQKMMKSGRNLINQLNTTTDIKQRIQLIYELFDHVGDNVTINGHSMQFMEAIFLLVAMFLLMVIASFRTPI